MIRQRGFTLLEMMIVVAIIGLVSAMSLFALGKATSSARRSGAKFDMVSLFTNARQLAMTQGTDVYVILTNLESTAAGAAGARALVYIDPPTVMGLRANPTDLMLAVNAAPNGVREELRARSVLYGDTGLAFVTTPGPAVTTDCGNLATALPPYISVTGTRTNTRTCARSWCTFCSVQPTGGCVGAIRYAADGSARIVTGGAGKGGVIKIIDTRAQADSPACIALSEPAGLAYAF